MTGQELYCDLSEKRNYVQIGEIEGVKMILSTLIYYSSINYRRDDLRFCKKQL